MTTSDCDVATHRGRRLSVALRIGGPAVVVVAVAVDLGAGAVLDGVRAVSPGALVVALALGVVTTAASAARWCLVARGLGLRIGFGAAVGDCYRAQFLNSLLPAGVLGDVHRAVDSGRRSGDLGRGVRAVVLERVAGQVVVVVAGIAVLLALPSPVRTLLGDLGGREALGPAALVAAGVLLALLGLATIPRVHRGLVTLVAGTRAGLLTLRIGPAVVGLSLVAMAGHLALLVVAALAVGVRATPGELLPLLVLSLLAMGLPLAVGGWGPREATTAAAFGIAGLGAGTGLATAVAFGVLALVSTLPGLGVLLLRRAVTTPQPRTRLTMLITARTIIATAASRVSQTSERIRCSLRPPRIASPPTAQSPSVAPTPTASGSW
jgi:glycosyltransferase 2 family protein